MNFIAIDIGTSFFKGAVVDVESMTLTHVARQPAPRPLPHDDPLFYELDPAQVIGAVRSLIDELAGWAECRGVLLCGQMGGLVLADDSGNARSPYISWLDRRTTAPHPSDSGTCFERFAQRAGTDAAARLGNEFRPGLPLPFLFWLNEQHRLPTDAIPLTLPDFVAANLCSARPVMEYTSATGTIDVRSRQVPEDVAAAAGLPGLDWPELVDFRHVVGEVEADGRTIPVYAAVGDHQCSLAGTLIAAGELSLNISTGSQVSTVADSADPGDYQLRPFFDGTWLKTITNIPAGRALNALLAFLTELGNAGGTPEAAWDDFFKQAETVDASDAAVNLAFFPSPVPGPGSIGNLREDNFTVAHVARASLETMAEYYDTFATRLFPQRDWNRVAFSGGLAQKSPLLRRLILDRLGDAHRLSASTEDALLGLGILGRVVGGLNETVASACADVAGN